ncbi:MAG: hypothetical protein Ct9H90mP22_8210 [Gammaproteobacteria bacterium]|nr:MAG: hypothetical protein Ct9H90mP22_8210 [Gammaproteobacteria bacterium]
MKQGLGWGFNFDKEKNERTRSNKVNPNIKWHNLTIDREKLEKMKRS